MTYNVLGGMLNLAQSITNLSNCGSRSQVNYLLSKFGKQMWSMAHI